MSENTPKQKKSRLCGWLAFLPAFAGIVILVYLGMNGVLSVVQGEIPQLNVGNLLLCVKVVCGLGAISFLISIVGLFLRKQKKGLCIFCWIVSIILMLVSGSLLYGFYFIFPISYGVN
jgi:hypothetical protein